ncbi:MAG TPA: ABC transporter permease [Bryobacteraceae bacterium]|jgi:ABC-2 type transport system permease protein|nr:ABC transporter permease [Bryobacteraceae bacterium]
MIGLLRATRMEMLKLRRTLALWASILVPFLLVAMTTALNLSRNIGGRFDPGAPPAVSQWESLMLDLVLFLWCLIGLPLFVSLETALLAGLEHRENTWKHLFALPIQRWTIYVAKLLVGSGLVCISSVVLAIGIGLEGLILLKLRPDLGLTWPIPWKLIFLRSFSFTPAVLLMLAVQTWVAVRWRSFVVAMSLGIGGTITGLIFSRSLRIVLSVSPHSAQVYLASFFPWSLPYAIIWNERAALLFNHATNLQQPAFVEGIIGGLLIAAFGCWNVIRKDVI